MIEYVLDEKNRMLTCVFAGRLDTAAAGPIAEGLRDKLATWPAGANATPQDGIANRNTPGELPDNLRVVFDLGGVDFVASAFLRICIETSRRVGKENLQVVKCSPFTHKTFLMAGMDELVSLHEPTGE